MSIEAMKLALEAWDAEEFDIKVFQMRMENCRQAIEQAEQAQPVAWKETDEVECPVCKDKGFPWPKCGHITYLERTAPPPRQPLTDEEIAKIWAYKWNGDLTVFARAIEAAHGIKENT